MARLNLAPTAGENARVIVLRGSKISAPAAA